jgi:hypothetical protein
MFYLVLAFAAAVGLDEAVIPVVAIRARVLEAIEVACVLSLLLRAEALTPAGRMLTFDAIRRFATLMLEEPFRSRQKSHWALLKFHMVSLRRIMV